VAPRARRSAEGEALRARLTHSALLSLQLGALAGTPASAADARPGVDWPSFRGPVASGVASGFATPEAWDATKGEGVLWKTAVPGIAVSSPIVWGDKLFVTTAVSTDPKASFRHGLYGDVEPSKDVAPHTWRLLCLDKKTGKVLWEKVAHEGVPRTKRHPKSSQASATPVTDGKIVVAHFGSEGLYAYDLSGKLLWKRDLGVLNAGWFYDPDYEWGVASSPILWRDLVIVQCDIQKGSFVAAYRAKDGMPLWRTERDEIPSWPTPTVAEIDGKAELVTHATKFIRGYDPKTGEELWRLGPNSEVTTPTPIVAHGLVYVTNGYRGIQPIYAIKLGGRGDLTLPEGKESSEFLAWTKKRGGPYTPTPLVYGDHLYSVTNQGVLTCWNAKTGEQLYQKRIGEQGGAYSASPVAADGKLYLAMEDGEVNVVKTGPEFQLLSRNPIGEVLMATPAISEGVLYVRGMQHVFAIGTTGKTPAR
jgi:outer membrane protein assembly factor BamB